MLDQTTCPLVQIRVLVSERSRHRFRSCSAGNGDDVWMDIPASLMSRISLSSGESPRRFVDPGVGGTVRSVPQNATALSCQLGLPRSTGQVDPGGFHTKFLTY